MITAASNSRIRRLVQLNQKAKLRREEKVFVVEGVRMFLEAPAEKLREVYVSERFLEHCGCRERLEAVGYEVVADSLFAKISDTCTPQGILCVAEQCEWRLEDMLKKEAPLLLLLENIQDPGNLGTMLRTGEGAGIDGVIASPDTVDLYNPKVIRSTMGSIYRVPYVRAEDFGDALEAVQRAGIEVHAAHLKGSRDYTCPDYTKGCAFLIGNEGNGLTEESAGRAGSHVRIPMAGQVESLNAAVASAVLLYEAARQRRALPGTNAPAGPLERREG